ncbi:MAG TPA: non-ribosomal peptide synthetase, partial [Gammaproteobacteria bacterium]|nr:non-ribosomal peptide synthetase [Gammaproteobacteria bacterium]
MLHCGAVNRILWQHDAFPIDETDVVLQKTPFSFDVSVWEFFWPLLVGSQLEIAKAEGHKDPSYLIGLIQQRKVTTLHFVPSMLRIFLQTEGAVSCSSLRRVICSGEALGADLRDQFFEMFPGVALENLYGPTEASVDVSHWSCSVDDKGVVPIGKPIWNTSLYVLDSSLNPVPIGVSGELHIGGVGLAEGYVNKPELTAEKFIANPFCVGERLYKTGDLARFRSDGTLEYLGRIDHQVKVRGFRIELGEIEAVIADSKMVNDQVVIVREEENQPARIIAYIAVDTETPELITEIKSYLQKRVPEFMIPSVFMILPELPLSSNGKVNKAALPPPGNFVDKSAEYIPARNNIEAKLVAIWEELLPVERVGVRDNFFELGGDSILSIQVVGRAKRFGLNFSTRDFFTAQTIESLATIISTSTLVDAEQGILTGELPLAPIQKWFFDQRLNNPDHFNQAIRFSLPRRYQDEQIQKALTAIIAHHDALRCRFHPHGSSWQAEYQSTTPEEIFISEVVNENSIDQLENIIQVRTREIQKSLSLKQGVLVQCIRFHLPNDSSEVVWVIHHLVTDGVSWRILLEDFQLALDQLSKGESINLGEKSSSYRQWVDNVNETLDCKDYSLIKDYWKKTEEAICDPIPIDYESGENLTKSLRAVSFSLDAARTQSLLTECNRAYHTEVNDLLLAGLLGALQKWSQFSKLKIALESHGRDIVDDSVEISRTVGWFTSIFPVLLEVPEPSVPDSNIKYIKDLLRSIPQQGQSATLCKYESCEEYDTTQLAREPQISFNYLGQLSSLSQTDLMVHEELVPNWSADNNHRP